MEFVKKFLETFEKNMQTIAKKLHDLKSRSTANCVVQFRNQSPPPELEN